jgi:hypothetical protein
LSARNTWRNNDWGSRIGVSSLKEEGTITDGANSMLMCKTYGKSKIMQGLYVLKRPELSLSKNALP